MKALKLIGEILSWIFMLYMIFVIFGMAKYFIVIEIIAVIISCPIFLKFLLNKLNVKHKAIIRVLVMIVLFFVSIYGGVRSGIIRTVEAIEGSLTEQINKEYSSEGEIELKECYIEAEGADGLKDIYAVTVEFIVRKDDNIVRYREEYIAIYDISTRECEEFEKISSRQV